METPNVFDKLIEWSDGIPQKEYEKLLKYIAYLQEKCNNLHYHYNTYEQWCELNDRK